MIFVTVGTQLPFDRLVRTVDDWAGRTGRDDVFAQIGPSEYAPRHMESAVGLDPAQFRARMEQAEFIVAHAGMGTIINALRMEKTLVVMPRKADLGEHRNDHQIATVRELGSRGLVHAVADERALADTLDTLGTLSPLPPLPEFAQASLIDRVRRFVHAESTPTGSR